VRPLSCTRLLIGIAIFFLGELNIVYTEQGARFSCGECDMDQLGFIRFILHFLKQFSIAARLVCSV
jgi:hypothetical protein